MTNTLHTLFQNRLPLLPETKLVTDVAFPLPDGLEGAARAFAGEIEADIYARPHNPTVRALTDAVNALEGGVGAVAYASGQAAVRNVFQMLTSAGTEIVASNHIFGGTVALHAGLLERFGVSFKWADPADAQSFHDAVTPRTRALFVEGVANPGSVVADLAGLRAVADQHNLPLIVDNTTTPLALQPFAHGADIVAYSATKYLNGFGNAAAGIVVDYGRFNFANDQRYPNLSQGVGGAPSVAQRFNERAFFKGLQSQLTVDGSILAPEKAAIILGNLPTLPERLEAHIANTKAVAETLSDHPAVALVHYAGLPWSDSYERAKKYLPHGVSGPILVTLKGGRAAAAHVIENLGDAFLHAVNIGDATRTLISHSETTTHRQMGDRERRAIGILPGSLRVSVSAGDVAPILKGLEAALRYAPV